MTLFTGCVLYAFATEVVYDEWLRPHINDKVWNEKHISNHIVFQQMYYSDKGRVYDKNKRIVLLNDVDWVVTSSDKDSLAVLQETASVDTSTVLLERLPFQRTILGHGCFLKVWLL